MTQEINDAVAKARQHIPQFAKEIHSLFVLNDWRWAMGDAYRVPTEEEVVATLRELLSGAQQDALREPRVGWGFCTSGRLAVRITSYSYVAVTLDLVPATMTFY